MHFLRWNMFLINIFRFVFTFVSDAFIQTHRVKQCVACREVLKYHWNRSSNATYKNDANTCHFDARLLASVKGVTFSRSSMMTFFSFVHTISLDTSNLKIIYCYWHLSSKNKRHLISLLRVAWLIKVKTFSFRQSDHFFLLLSHLLSFNNFLQVGRMD